MKLYAWGQLKRLEKQLAQHVKEPGTGNVLAVHVALFLVFAILTWLSDGVYGGSDNAAHYKMARFAFDQPRFFFDYWGKPGYTVIMAPFAQMGFYAVRLANVLMGVVSSYFLYLILRQLGYKNAWLAPVILLFAPGYITAMLSTNTETSFIFITILGFYLYMQDKKRLGIFLMSLTPLFRPEAVFFMGILGLAVLLRRQFRLIPWFFSGGLLFVLAGILFYGGFAWLQDFIPYGPIESYGGGTGNFLHYGEKTKKIFGIPHALLLAAGLVITVVELFRPHTWSNRFYLMGKHWFMVFGFIGFYLIQSIAVWKGIATSYGPMRHMVPAIPFGVVLVLDAFRLLQQAAIRIPFVYPATLLVVLFFLIKTPFVAIKLPTPYFPEQDAVHKASQWLKENGYYDNKLYFFNSFFSVYNPDLDVFDPQRACFAWQIRNPERLPKNSIVLWDPHFALSRGTPLDMFKGNPNYTMLEMIQPGYKFKKHGHPYGIYVFQKQTPASNLDGRENPCQ